MGNVQRRGDLPLFLDDSTLDSNAIPRTYIRYGIPMGDQAEGSRVSSIGKHQRGNVTWRFCLYVDQKSKGNERPPASQAGGNKVMTRNFLFESA